MSRLDAGFESQCDLEPAFSVLCFVVENRGAWRHWTRIIGKSTFNGAI